MRKEQKEKLILSEVSEVLNKVPVEYREVGREEIEKKSFHFQMM
ncbi:MULTISPECIES: hypothetical protein [unclassified Bacillus cereus group]|nr:MULTISPECIES: hypothetical protein [unclassified Bacillus cereus group]